MSSLKTGQTLPDYELPDQNGKTRSLSGLQDHNPMVLTLARGHFCPKEHQFHSKLVNLYDELAVSYVELVTVTTDEQLELLEFKKSLGAQWTFLSDPERTIQQDLDIAEYTDPKHDPMIPHVLILKPGLEIHKYYNGYCYAGRPTAHEILRDLREVNRHIRFDWDLTHDNVRQAWERGEKDKFWPYDHKQIT